MVRRAYWAILKCHAPFKLHTSDPSAASPHIMRGTSQRVLWSQSNADRSAAMMLTATSMFQAAIRSAENYSHKLTAGVLPVV